MGTTTSGDTIQAADGSIKMMLQMLIEDRHKQDWQFAEEKLLREERRRDESC
uniref:Uncharacterized protein n=1 Tax=Amphimedon queenslandica TaxID=400682 RepID=A0A1X7U901_AMPQE